MIKLIVGLGNPGAHYAATRHNIGFWAVDLIAQESGVILRSETRFHGCVAQTKFHGFSLRLLQPQTFMNRSGLAVRALAQFYKILPEEILIVHDELELPPGTVKLKRSGSSGGHNGLKDITLHLSTSDYWRLRIGIGHPRHPLSQAAQSKVTDFVLTPPQPAEHILIEDAIRRALITLPEIVKGDIERAMNHLHRTAS